MKSIETIVNDLKQYYGNADEARDIIENCALTAAAADAVGSILPVLAIPSLIVSCVGAVWVMYAQVCKSLNIRIKENALKLLGRVALSNIAANAVGYLGATLLGSMIPGASILVSAVVTYVAIYLAGMLFLAMLSGMAATAKDPHDFTEMSEEQMAKIIRASKVTAADVKAARTAYAESRRT